MNRRSRTRFKTDLTVKITCPDLPGCAAKARLADLSVHGLSLILKENLHVGSMVQVEWGGVAFVGELIHCQPHGQEFLVGLKVDDPVYETAKKYVNQ
jgi:hypothetical protein